VTSEGPSDQIIASVKCPTLDAHETSELSNQTVVDVKELFLLLVPLVVYRPTSIKQRVAVDYRFMCPMSCDSSLMHYHAGHWARCKHMVPGRFITLHGNIQPQLLQLLPRRGLRINCICAGPRDLPLRQSVYAPPPSLSPLVYLAFLVCITIPSTKC